MCARVFWGGLQWFIEPGQGDFKGVPAVHEEFLSLPDGQVRFARTALTIPNLAESI